MQNVKPGDHMAASAKRAINGAMTDAKAQRVAAALVERPTTTPAEPGTPAAARPTTTPAEPGTPAAARPASNQS